MFSICMCAYYQSNPKESHVMAIKRIFRDLLDTQNTGLQYSKQSSLNLIGYFDVDFTRYRLDRKSTSDTYQFLDINLNS